MSAAGPAPVDPARFRDAMASFASGVTIVTTMAADGEPRGFTASAFASLSVAPPMVLACLSTEADSHEAFQAAQAFAVSVLRPQHHALALRFAARGADKFARGPFVPGRFGAPVLGDALAVVECELAATYPGGDHTILTGLVRHARSGTGTPLVHYGRRFWALPGDAVIRSPAGPPGSSSAGS